MIAIDFYTVDVFASEQYQGNQLAVFLDFQDQISEEYMLKIAQEINFAESVFVKTHTENHHFTIRIFTPEYEVPFAGHPCLGTSYIISRFLIDQNPKPNTIFLDLLHSCIEIQIPKKDSSTQVFYMLQAQPEFRQVFSIEEITSALPIPEKAIQATLPIQEITTGLPYILVPLRDLKCLETIKLDEKSNA